MSKLQNDFTTPEQSKRLLELGVPADSANCYYVSYKDSEDCKISIRTKGDTGNAFFKVVPYTPCWSVGRLMEIFAICFDPDFIEFDIFADGTSFLQQMLDKFETCIDAMDFSKLEE